MGGQKPTLKQRGVRPDGLVSSRTTFRGRRFQVLQDRVREPALPNGQQTRQSVVLREYVRHGGSVVVLPVLEDGSILLVRQYRHAVGQFVWEAVAGHLEPAEPPLTAARRELEEETGYRARRFEKLAEFFPSPGILSEAMTLYRATGLRPGPPAPESDEALQARVFRPAEWQRLLRKKKLKDGKTLVGLLLHERTRRRGRKPRAT